MKNFNIILSGSLLWILTSCGAPDPSFKEESLGSIPSGDGGKIEVLVDGDAPVTDSVSGVSSVDPNTGVQKTSKLTIGKASTGSGLDAEANKGQNGKSADFESPSNAELISCGSHLTGNIQFLKIASKSNTVALNANTAVAMKVTGSKNVMSLTFDESSSVIGGICVFVAGDNNHVNIEVPSGLTVQNLYVVLRGNSPVVTVTVKGTIVNTSQDLAGHNPSFVIK